MLRTTIPCTLILMAGFALGQTGSSKGPLSPAEQAAAIDAVREYVLSYTKSLPNYACTLTTRRITSPLNAGNKTPPELTDIEEQLSLVDGKEIRRIARIDGRPASAESGGRPSGMSFGEFGNVLDTVFEPATGAVLRWDRVATLNSRKVDVFAYRVPQTSGYLLMGAGGRVKVPFEGFVYADAQTHEVLRMQVKCTMVPDTFPIQNAELTLDYKATQVAGREFILPSHLVLQYVDHDDDRQHTNDGRYSAYRQFSADATIQFGDANQ
jgi:hypothetical protein